jgi:selenoprotein W-related protein
MNNYQIEIHYCTQCRWLTRAAWVAQELLITFDSDISRLSLVPKTGGIFDIYLNDVLIASRKADAGFIEMKQLKQRIRDVIDPERSLGHSDN